MLPASRVRVRILLGCVVAVAAPRVAAASDGRPWAEGVSPAAQASAFSLFDEGNRLFEQSRYEGALEKYEEAIRFWDHPVIHFNMAVCYIHLDRPTAAYEHLAKALVYGQAPLGPDLHGQGLTYEKLLAGRVGHIQVSCDQPGVEVTLDGRPLFTGPGKATRIVLPGKHQLVARRPEYLTDARMLTVLPGKLRPETIALQPVVRAARMERRWRAWVPWAVTSSGVAVAVGGFGFRVLAGSAMDKYDRTITKLCTDGCRQDEIPRWARDARDRAAVENAAAIASFAVGGAIAAAGGILLFLNQPRPVASERRARSSVPVVAPTLSSDGAGVAVTFSF